MQTFGQGVLFNHIRIFGPDKIRDESSQYQERWKEYFLWVDEDSALSEELLAARVIVGDTFNGDEFVVSPAYPGQIFYLPQDAALITNLGTGLEGAITRVIGLLRKEIANYPEDEQEEWDLRPVFNVKSF